MRQELMVWQVPTEQLEPMVRPALRDPSGLRGLLVLLATKDPRVLRAQPDHRVTPEQSARLVRCG